MGAAESTETTANNEQNGKVRRRYCGNFLGGGEDDVPKGGDTIVKSQRSPSVTSRTLTAAPAGSPMLGSTGGYASSPSTNTRSLTIAVPGSAAASPQLAPQQLGTRMARTGSVDSVGSVGSAGSGGSASSPTGAALTERERQELELAAEREAKRALRKSQQLNKKLIKQIKRETAAEERARIREEIARQQAEAEAKAQLAQAEFELKSWSIACQRFRADRAARSLMSLPPTMDTAVKVLADKANKRKCIILEILSLERCDMDLAAAQVIDHDDAARHSMSPSTASRALATTATATSKASPNGKDNKQSGGAAADAKGELALKDHFAFKFTIRNPTTGVESVGAAWAIVYKTVKADAVADRDGIKPCLIGECIGGWTKK